MNEKYVAPKFEADGFHCPHCATYAHQIWYPSTYGTAPQRSNLRIGHLSMSHCSRCRQYALWHDQEMLYPIASIAPLPTEDMPPDVKEDFSEARKIVNASPRAAAALLRLALQKLMPHLRESGHNLNDDIASLVKKGLPPQIQQALDAVRVIGNNAVHPGQIDLTDDTETAIALFDTLNMIVRVMITQPRDIDVLYGKIPDSTKKSIEERDDSPE